jgi:hypothetical protein
MQPGKGEPRQIVEVLGNEAPCVQLQNLEVLRREWGEVVLHSVDLDSRRDDGAHLSRVREEKVDKLRVAVFVDFDLIQLEHLGLQEGFESLLPDVVSLQVEILQLGKVRASFVLRQHREDVLVGEVVLGEDEDEEKLSVHLTQDGELLHHEGGGIETQSQGSVLIIDQDLQEVLLHEVAAQVDQTQCLVVDGDEPRNFLDFHVLLRHLQLPQEGEVERIKEPLLLNKAGLLVEEDHIEVEVVQLREPLEEGNHILLELFVPSVSRNQDHQGELPEIRKLDIGELVEEEGEVDLSKDLETAEIGE